MRARARAAPGTTRRTTRARTGGSGRGRSTHRFLGARASIVWQLRLRGEASPSSVCATTHTSIPRAGSTFLARASCDKSSRCATRAGSPCAARSGGRPSRRTCRCRRSSTCTATRRAASRWQKTRLGGGTLQARWRKPLREGWRIARAPSRPVTHTHARGMEDRSRAVASGHTRARWRITSRAFASGHTRERWGDDARRRVWSHARGMGGRRAPSRHTHARGMKGGASFRDASHHRRLPRVLDTALKRETCLSRFKFDSRVTRPRAAHHRPKPPLAAARHRRRRRRRARRRAPPRRRRVPC